jgi:tetratricopeptide (TPR) repeat protein
MTRRISSVSRWLAAAVLATVLAAGQVAAHIHDPRAIEADPATATSQIAPLLEGLGDHHFAVTTANERSQRFFDQGLRLTYAFNHSEALRAFKEAVRLDPTNAMAYWGWALVLGPNINLPMQPAVVPQAYRAIQQALALGDRVTERERAYIEALARRYTEDAEADRAPLDEAYASAMEELVERYPDDLDAATLYAAALMNLSPWDYWNLDGSAKPLTEDLLAALQSVVDRAPRHPGALHYYIHAVEARHPERGEGHADALAGLMPGAGHLVHMPSHIYMRVGRFRDSYEANVRAVQADEGYITQCRAQGIYPLGYYPHNIHFMVWSAMMQGNRAAALEAARKIVHQVPHELAESGNAWTLYETFLSQPMFVLVRFGMWDEMLAEPRPEVDSKFMVGAWHYGRALAYIHTDRLAEARREVRALDEIREEMSTIERYIGFSHVGTLLTIASEVAAGELAFEEGYTMEALARLERAVRLEDGLLYNEPPDWYFPVRQFLGAMLLEAGRPNEAEVVYSADLRKNAGNGHSLFGLRQALEAQGKTGAALQVAGRFELAWADADVELTTSRY